MCSTDTIKNVMDQIHEKRSSAFFDSLAVLCNLERIDAIQDRDIKRDIYFSNIQCALEAVSVLIKDAETK